MVPVEQTSTFVGLIESASAVIAAIAVASRRPVFPTHALAQPLFIRIA